MNTNDLTITSLETITAFSLGGDYLFTLDELQSATIAHTEEKNDITGKGGTKISSLKRNKAVTISGNNGMVSNGLLAAQVGGKLESRESIRVLWTDYLTVKDNSAETTYKAVGTTGAEIKAIMVRTTDGTAGASFTQNATVGEGKFTYADKKITFAEGALADGTEIVVFYDRNIKGDYLENDSNSYSAKVQLYVDALGEDKCGNIYHIQFYIPKADFSGEFDLEMGENQTVHAFSADALSGACGVGSAKTLWTYTVFGQNTADVA